jgi:hypothetical protein
MGQAARAADHPQNGEQSIHLEPWRDRKFFLPANQVIGMKLRQLAANTAEVCERLNFTLTKSDRREEVVSWVEHWQALWL